MATVQLLQAAHTQAVAGLLAPGRSSSLSPRKRFTDRPYVCPYMVM